mmetsp:Transcript_18860/g.47149  ORF Transcript_18860/g.47149 Transcript_18860/m.47149 type:complete len:95 (+) Transcript_18860:116-400(+)|eukprot:CAMPEP_0178988324 /NCGR_PEP_ID=MMETSP0795-20121207/3751_1 /TAXON_ID=88552 /ORGANISM="Amoebophrya sp., Strain Ameob2" /LENGTH=94 /DNA_ID=CAMNT_0020679593 /DNA_START=61 /DNA_END=345 /DNA_ORIENTATION=+
MSEEDVGGGALPTTESRRSILKATQNGRNGAENGGAGPKDGKIKRRDSRGIEIGEKKKHSINFAQAEDGEVKAEVIEVEEIKHSSKGICCGIFR